MKNQIRIDNLQRIIDEQFKSWRALSIAIGKQPSYMNEVKNGKREFSLQLVEYIETRLSLKSGTLDHDSDIKEPTLIQIYDYDFHNNIIVARQYIDQQHLIQSNIESSGLRIYTMPDDSMAPEIVSGAKIIIDCKQTSVTENKIYLVKFNQRILLRKLFIINPNQEFLLKSVNSNYPEEAISRKKLEIIGRAVGLIWQPLE